MLQAQLVDHSPGGWGSELQPASGTFVVRQRPVGRDVDRRARAYLPPNACDDEHKAVRLCGCGASGLSTA
jgi:hypothetical protein